MTTAQKIIKAAEAELGVVEQPLGSNRGERVELYQSLTWLAGTGWPWCVAFAWEFVAWRQALEKPCPYETAAVEQLERWARANGWAAGTGQVGDLACLDHGSHVTILHHKLPGGKRFAGIGGNQSDGVRISEYDLSRVTTWVRVPAGLVEPPAPPKNRPTYEVVRGEGEKARVVFTSPTLDAAAERAKKLIRAGATGARIRKRPPRP